MLQAYGKTANEWGSLPPDVRHFHEVAWRAEQEQKRRERERIESQY